MKALTISQPYASLIANGEKWVENRRWPSSYRGPLAIHAGKGTQYLSKSEMVRFATGCVVAVARLASCVRIGIVQFNDMVPANRKHIAPGTTKFWSEIARHPHTEGPWCWILEDIYKLESPVPFRGAQGLFDVPDELLTEALK